MRPTHKAPADMRPTYKAAADVHAMPEAVAGIGVKVVVPIAAIRPSVAIPVMSPTRPAMNLVDKVTIFDGVAQAVGATECDGGGRLYERAGSHDGCGCNSHCENPHGIPPEIRTCRPPLPSHARMILYQTLVQRFVAESFIAHSCHRTFVSCASAFMSFVSCEQQNRNTRLRNKTMRAASRPPAAATSVTLAVDFRCT
jgi:hypothetical protein